MVFNTLEIKIKITTDRRYHDIIITQPLRTGVCVGFTHTNTTSVYVLLGFV